MVRVLSLLFALFTLPAHALTVGAQNTVSLAAAVSPALTPCTTNKTLSADMNANGGYPTFRDYQTATAYTPSGSNKFYITGIREVMGTNVSAPLQLFYSTADCGVNAALNTSCGTQTYYGGAIAGQLPLSGYGGASSSAPVVDAVLPGVFLPNGKYLGVYYGTTLNTAQGSAVFVYGCEAL